MTNEFRPFTYGRSMSIFLSDYMYTSPEVAIREMIANSRDQYLHESTIGKPRRNLVIITIDSEKKKFRCADFATGILDIADFQMMGSNALGKTVGSRTSTVENPDEEMVGQFHVGKASFAKMSSVKTGPIVTFYSNNGKEGLILQMLIRETEVGKELGWEDPPYRLPPKLIEEARDERVIGLTVEVHNVVDKVLRLPYVDALIGEQFGLLIAKDWLHIGIRDLKHPDDIYLVKPSSAYIDSKSIGEKLILDSNHYMTHCLVREEKPPYDNIRVLVKGILIKSIHVPYKVTGWINYNRLRLNGPRDAFLLDDRYEELLKYFNPLLDERFERQHTKKDAKFKGVKDLTKLLQDMINNAMKLYERDPLVLSGVFNQQSEIKGNVVQTNDKDNRDKMQKQRGPISRTGEGKEGNDPTDAEGEIVIPINRKRRKKGGKGTKGGKTATWQTDEENGRTKDYLAANLDENKRPETGPIKPELKIEDKGIGLDKPVTYMETASKLLLNTDQPATYGILMMQRHYRRTSLGPFMAEALAEFITRNRPTSTSITEYRQMVNDIYTQSFFRNV